MKGLISLFILLFSGVVYGKMWSIEFHKVDKKQNKPVIFKLIKIEKGKFEATVSNGKETVKLPSSKQAEFYFDSIVKPPEVQFSEVYSREENLKKGPHRRTVKMTIEKLFRRRWIKKSYLYDQDNFREKTIDQKVDTWFRKVEETYFKENHKVVMKLLF